MLIVDGFDVDDDVDDVVGVVGETSLCCSMLMLNVEQSWQTGWLLHRTPPVRPSVSTEPRTAPDTDRAHSSLLFNVLVLKQFYSEMIGHSNGLYQTKTF